ncbi:MAG: AarF/UbiB family protein [Phycisphaerales bacterium]|jgi:ubiquinone biosynthesis protein|nr:AarF/UbiB family protein [Phycisphaerales bacterium]
MPTTKIIRNLPRMREIVSVAAKFGFGEVIRDTKLGEFLGKFKKIHEAEQKPAPVRFRLALEELGPTFMKLGQVLSMRPDLVPPDWSAELANLQDSCPTVPWDDIREELEKEYGTSYQEMFTSIEETPIGDGSMAQVHRAVTKADEKVVLKILRPNIEKIVKSDLQLLETVASLLKSHGTQLGFNPQEVIDTFSEALGHELDLRHEADSTKMLAEMTSDDTTKFPKVFSDLSTKRILVIEEVKGTELTKWKKANYTQEQRDRIVANGAHAVVKQTLEIGFFHADPHPGNIFVLEEQKLCFIDCGMTGRVEESMRKDLAMLLYGVSENNIDTVTKSFLRLADITIDDVDERTLRKDLQDFVERFTEGPLGEVDMGSMLTAFLDGLRKNNIKCPGDLILLIKALITIEGVGKEMSPKFNLVDYAQLPIEKLVKSQLGFKAIKDRSVASAQLWAQLAERLPDDATRMLDRLRRNKVRFKMDVDSLDDMTDAIDRSSKNVSWAMIISALIVGSSIMVLANRAGTMDLRATLGLIGYIFAGTLGVWRVIQHLRQGR